MDNSSRTMDNSVKCDCVSVIKTDIEHYDNCLVVLHKRHRDGEIKMLPRDATGRILPTNQHLKDLHEDNIYHLALGTSTHDLRSMFGDVKFVCMGGTAQRMLHFAKRVAKELSIENGSKDFQDLTADSHRYSMFKVGPVLAVNHGVGISTLNVVLQEVIKLLQYAEAVNPIFIRIGTSGGLGVEPGTVVVSNRAFNGLMKNTYELAILGKLISLKSDLDQKLSKELTLMSEPSDGFQVISSGTMAAEDFYQGQGRLDGPFCNYTETDKLEFLNKLKSVGVVNIEMEVTAFAAFTKMAGVRSAVVCVTILDRFKGDQVHHSKELFMEFQERPMTIVLRYIGMYLRKIGFSCGTK